MGNLRTAAIEMAELLEIAGFETTGGVTGAVKTAVEPAATPHRVPIGTLCCYLDPAAPGTDLVASGGLTND
jgi:hypothetical protein